MSKAQAEWGASPRMATFDDHAIIEPVRDLAVRASRPGTQKDVDKALAAAEAQLANLRTEFPVWMAAEVMELDKAWKAYQAGEANAVTMLFRRVHDIRGQAGTFGFPLAGRAADILCKLMDAVGEVPASIIEAHLYAIRAIVRDNVNTDNHPVGVPMIKALEKLSQKLVQDRLKGEPG